MQLAIFFCCTILCAVQNGEAQRETLRIPSGSDSCNVVNLNFGTADDAIGGERGPQGPTGKRGIPGTKGEKGEQGVKGEIGPQGPTPEISIQDVTSSVLKAIATSDCIELMRDHGITESGYFLMRSNDSRHAVYNYCDFEIRRGMDSCQQLRESLGSEFRTGYYLRQGEGHSAQNFIFCTASIPKNCGEVARVNAKVLNETGGVFDIYPYGDGEEVEVYCDLETDRGDWIVFQRRMDGSVDFFRGWNDYVNGFGEKDKEFWLGLENIHRLTNGGTYELRIDLIDWEGSSAYANYGTFSVGPASDNYRISVGSFSGTAGDAFATYNMNKEFSTNDHGAAQSCANSWKGAWWYGGCSHSNLNGLYEQPSSNKYQGVIWHEWKNAYEKLKFSEMKFRKTH